ncbi:hypothetical protein [Mycolicibacterium fortuitum]|uniref:Uncharacterized protein n=1 Tax=Mycolicibacterium fortuitum subsp. fortuitum DSM 46621 = ATCC 6841 = JCM 6387 TaxID=1214102 RepID=K0VLE1_MYCFO|nr:hypothetical protein [Mycolicibacterium fortuitum]AIY44744.1 hypothetical protein G155_03200 [Mycobacterium sp. VKM Ac-1817D]CRL79614.1 hypothetical protein CPGR_02809 [Mycolicibacter nonchromogenicus]EJZ15788.1 hypothetical protein MFORT_02724 [Mycolicibacterium fortuitum subsp. fortuitum DSM 46621 = ATCC 6841 = JCM 6387]WEV33453.1 hypothetical protein OMF10_03280 [Mycolicibacterium fortuitum]CRL54787.1 hypothetical protein CPGR_02084 [Mycolicibacterium fortuitum subsp. fortuitum DSM 46621
MIYTTQEQREQRFTDWWKNYGKPWAEVRTAAGNTCWTDDIEERRALFMRRYQRPEPPKSLPSVSLATIRGKHRRWVPVTVREQSAA